MLCEMGDIVASRKGCVDFSANSSVLGNTLVVASRKGCVDFSIKQESVNVSIKGSHLARDAWILAYMFFRSIRKESSHPARDAWILATYFTNVNGKIAVASRKGCVDFSFGTYETEKERDVSHLARDAWILA